MAAKFPGRPQSLRVRLLPLGGAVAQRLRGFQSAEHKKSFSAATWIFCMEPNFLGVKRGAQPLFRGSSASKSLAVFWFSFVRQKRTYPAAMLFAKGEKLVLHESTLHGKHILLNLERQSKQTGPKPKIRTNACFTALKTYKTAKKFSLFLVRLLGGLRLLCGQNLLL